MPAGDDDSMVLTEDVKKLTFGERFRWQCSQSGWILRISRANDPSLSPPLMALMANMQLFIVWISSPLPKYVSQFRLAIHYLVPLNRAKASQGAVAIRLAYEQYWNRP